MAITATLGRSTPNTLVYILAHDGAAGDTLTITNAVMLADSVAGPLHELIQEAAPNVLQATRFFGGTDPLNVADYLNPGVGYADLLVTKTSDVGAAGLAWTVATGSDGTNAEINVGQTAESTAKLMIEFKHSIER